MSLSDPSRVDVVTVRDGWAVIAIHHFDVWEPADELRDALEWKIATAQAHVASAAFQQRYHRLPVRIELHATDAPPSSIVAVCRRQGVVIAG